MKSILEFGAVPDSGQDAVPAFVQAMSDSDPFITVPAGRYHMIGINDGIELKSGKTIECDPGAEFYVPESAAVNVRKSKNGYVLAPVFGVWGTHDRLMNFAIRGGAFKIDKTDVTPIQIDREFSKNIEVSHVSVYGNNNGNKAGYGIFVNWGSNVKLISNEIRYTRYGGFFARLISDADIVDNIVEFAGVDVGYPFDDPALAKQDEDYWSAAGISAPSARNCHILGNRLNHIGGAGIILRGGGTDCSGNIVAGNHLSNIGKGGIGIGVTTNAKGSSKDNAIVGNTIRGYMLRWGDSGINVNHRGPTGSVSNIVIENNVIDMLPTSGNYPPHAASNNVAYAQIIFDSSFAEPVSDISIKNNLLRNIQGAAVSVNKGHACIGKEQQDRGRVEGSGI